jgi:hypothetical protein
MKYIIFILFLFGCPAAKQYAPHSLLNIEKGHYIVYNQPQFPENYHQIEYVGNWTHMISKPGSFASTTSDTARYQFWGYGVQVSSELWDNHDSVQVIIDHKYIETINLKSPANTTDNLIYSNMELRTGNHVIELVPTGLFVLNTLGIYYYADPTPEEIIYDTIYIDRIDTVYLDTMIYVHDTTYIPVHDTTYIDNYHLIRPTITYDTILID